jgi:glycosyltransferase involved in cell wall biosynthesis
MPIAVIFSIFGALCLLLIKLLSLWYRIYVLITLLYKAISTDVVFLQQVTPPIWFTKILLLFNSKIVFDIDDAVFLIKPSQTIAVLRAAEVAAPGSHYNQEFCLSYCKKVIFLPTPVPLDRFIIAEKSAKNSKENTFRIGWVGSPSTAKYLDIIAEPFRNLVTRYPNRLKLIVVGLGQSTHLLPDILKNNEHIEIIPWVEPDRVPEVVATFDIGIMPLHDTEWEQGKCGLKALEYMAAGIPAICSGVGENNYIVTDGINGYIANTSAEWETKIEALINDPELRFKLGQAGKKTIQERYSTEHCFEILLTNILEPLVSSKGKSM